MDRFDDELHSTRALEIDPSEEDERLLCCPHDPPERAEPNLPPDASGQHPPNHRSPQARREFYQNQFPEEPRG